MKCKIESAKSPADNPNGGGVEDSTRRNPASYKDVIEKRVLESLENHKVYLDPDISLQKFCAAISTNTTYLSSTINDYFGCSFRTLINKYRIKYAIELMHTTRLPIQTICTKCGFASRSAFYASFRAITDMSPHEYLRKSKQNLVIF